MQIAIDSDKEKKDTFLKDLRQQTAQCHQALEDNKISTSLMADGVTEEDYKVYLKKLYGFVASFERDIFPILSNIITDIESRRKAHLLADDLASLGVNDIDTIALLDWKKSLIDIPSAMGGMYVLEGSTLGGNLIYKRVHSVLGYNEEKGAKYFAAYGPQTGKMWKGFLETFTEYTIINQSRQAVIDSAIATFTRIDAWFSDTDS